MKLPALKKLALFVCLFACLALAACDSDVVNPGEVALVNGTPITLKQLQAAHDSMILAGDSPNRDREALRQEYSAVLSELIAQELVAQELERRDLSITPEELEEAIPAFMTVVMMPFAYSIADGIGLGFIFYCVVKLVSGKGGKVSPIMYGVAALFVLRYIILATI